MNRLYATDSTDIAFRSQARILLWAEPPHTPCRPTTQFQLPRSGVSIGYGFASVLAACVLLIGCSSSESENATKANGANRSAHAANASSSPRSRATVVSARRATTREHGDLADSPTVALATPSHAVVSLGYLDPGQRQTFVVTVVNPFDHAVAIQRAISDCSCLRFADPPKELAPGPNELTLVFTDESEETRGTFHHQRMILEPADSALAPLEILVTASVGLPLEYASDEGIPREEPLRIADLTQLPSVTLINHSGQEIRILYSTSTLPGILASIPRNNTVPAGGTLSIPLRYIAEDAAGPTNDTPRSGTVLLHTDHERQPTITIPVAWSGAAM